MIKSISVVNFHDCLVMSEFKVFGLSIMTADTPNAPPLQ